MLDNDTLDALCQALLPVAKQAGAIIEEQAAKGVKVLRKMDDSPVTAADQLAEDYILSELRKLDAGFKIIGEELIADQGIPDLDPKETYWLVDALDGTKEFIKGTGEYTVNIGLIENQTPILGVVYIPAQDTLYYGYGDTAFKQVADNKAVPISTRSLPNSGLTVVASKSHGDTSKIDALLKGRAVEKFINHGSSLKFCKIAEGVADIYPRFGPTCEWDTAAAHAVLLASGGKILNAETMQSLMYGKVDNRFLNPEFIAHSGHIKL